LNVKVLIFSKKTCKVHNVEVLSQDPLQEKKSTSLILANLKLGFEPHVLNLFTKSSQKTPKKGDTI
jgi:hypothetical protein